VAANSALSGSASVAEFTGFSVSGFLVQLFTAPIAIAVDAASFVGSAILLATIRRPEPPRPPVTDREPILREIREGLRVVLRSRVLLAIAAAHSATHILWGVFGTTYLLLATQEIGLGPAAIGIIAGIGGAGSFVGAALAERVVRRFGIGRTMLYGLIAMSAGNLLIPLAPSGAVLLGAAFLIGQQLIGDSGGTLYEVVETSLTQSIVDGRILGRVNATIELFTTILALAGAVLGGIVAEVLGLRAAMFAGVLGGATAIVFIWFSPIRSMVGPPPPLTIPPFTPERAPLVE
jgi:MFS family permease